LEGVGPPYPRTTYHQRSQNGCSGTAQHKSMTSSPSTSHPSIPIHISRASTILYFARYAYYLSCLRSARCYEIYLVLSRITLGLEDRGITNGQYLGRVSCRSVLRSKAAPMRPIYLHQVLADLVTRKKNCEKGQSLGVNTRYG
jgi:hypothetical protein